MQKTHKSDFFLITGFLGSGKTTFLKNVLNSVGEKRRIAIIQNEFAPADVDGKELSGNKDSFKLIEINNGSVFCVCQMGNFINILEKLINEFTPEMIFLEASGLSDPVNILELLRHENIRHRINLRHIIAIADTSWFLKSLNLLGRIRHQLMIADTIIMNKTDLCMEGYENIEEIISQINPFANIIRSSFCKIPVSNIPFHTEITHKAAENMYGKKPGGRPDVNTFVLKTNDLISLSDLNKMIKELAPEFMRIKGFVNILEGQVLGVQTVFEQIEIKQIFNYEGPTILIFFSQSETIKSIREKYKYMFVRQ